MEVTRVQPQKPPLQQLFRVTFAGLLFLGAVSTWAIVNMYQEERTTMANMHTQMKPAYTYFDTNRQTKPINQIQMVLPTSATSTATCPNGLPLMNLYTWEGNNAGYKATDGTWSAGTTSAVGAITINENGPAVANVFKGVSFCASTMKLTSFTQRLTSTTACPGTGMSAQTPCSSCWCSTTKPGWTAGNPPTLTESFVAMQNSCPYSSFTLTTATAQPNEAAGSKFCNAIPAAKLGKGVKFTGAASSENVYARCGWYQQGNSNTGSWLIGLQVSVYGSPCVNPNMHQKPGTLNGWTNLLRHSYTGCGVQGTNSMATATWANANQNLQQFYKENSATWNQNKVGAELNAELSTRQAGTMINLYTMHRIEMNCQSPCQQLNLGTTMTALLTQMNAAYSDLTTMIYVSAIGGGLCLLWCLYLVNRKSEATQEEYVQFWGATLLVVVVTCVLLYMFQRNMRNTYETARGALPRVAACVTDSTWKKLPTALHTATDMTGERNWATYWLVVGCLLAAGMLFVMVRTSQALEMLNRPEPDMY